MNRSVSFALKAVIVVGIASAALGEARPDGKTDEIRVGSIVGMRSPSFSADGRHIAYITSSRAGQSIIVDGKPGETFEAAADLTFSPDGKRLAFRAKQGNGQAVVVDGATGAVYDGIAGHPVFSDDGKCVAYAAKDKRGWFVVVDGAAGAAHVAVKTAIVFSPGGKRVAYIAVAADGKQAVIVDGRAGVAFDDVSSLPVFSRDGQRVAYVAKRDNRHLMVVDGHEEGAQFDDVLPPAEIFSPNGKRVVYTAVRGQKAFVVIDGQPGDGHDGIGSGTPVFSHDGMHVAYWAKDGNQARVFVDGKPQQAYGSIGDRSLSFSPDGARISYGAFRLPSGTVMQTPDGGKVLLETTGGGSFRKQVAVVDGKEGPEFDAVGEGPVVFSDDGKRFAYTAQKVGQRGIQWCVVVNGNVGASYDHVGRIAFSQNGTHVAYQAANGSKGALMVVDGQAIGEYDLIAQNAPVFSADGVLEFLAAKDNSLYRVRYVPAR